MLRILRQIAKTGMRTEAPPAPADEMAKAARLQADVLRTLGRALAIRQVDAGSCNGCELEIHALGNPYYNIEGMGIRFVASPRHADMLLVTGPVSKHMAIALRRTYDATPEPKLVVAVGDCGCTGGIFGESYATLGRVSNVIPVDAEVPGCPPTPTALLHSLKHFKVLHENNVILTILTADTPRATPKSVDSGSQEEPSSSSAKQ